MATSSTLPKVPSAPRAGDHRAPLTRDGSRPVTSRVDTATLAHVETVAADARAAGANVSRNQVVAQTLRAATRPHETEREELERLRREQLEGLSGIERRTALGITDPAARARFVAARRARRATSVTPPRLPVGSDGLTDFERRDAAKIKDPDARKRFIAGRLKRKAAGTPLSMPVGAAVRADDAKPLNESEREELQRLRDDSNDPEPREGESEREELDRRRGGNDPPPEPVPDQLRRSAGPSKAAPAKVAKRSTPARPTATRETLCRLLGLDPAKAHGGEIRHRAKAIASRSRGVKWSPEAAAALRTHLGLETRCCDNAVMAIVWSLTTPPGTTNNPYLAKIKK